MANARMANGRLPNFSDIQGIWDRLHKKAHLNLVVCGSVDRILDPFGHRVGADVLCRNPKRHRGGCRRTVDEAGKRLHAAARAVVDRDFDAFAGRSLERYFRAKFLEEGRYTRIGGWWDRKGENEIDLVCENELTGSLDFFEVKTDATRFSPLALDAKVANFFVKNPALRKDRHVVSGLSLDDM